MLSKVGKVSTSGPETKQAYESAHDAHGAYRKY